MSTTIKSEYIVYSLLFPLAERANAVGCFYLATRVFVSLLDRALKDTDGLGLIWEKNPHSLSSDSMHDSLTVSNGRSSVSIPACMLKEPLYLRSCCEREAFSKVKPRQTKMLYQMELIAELRQIHSQLIYLEPKVQELALKYLEHPASKIRSDFGLEGAEQYQHSLRKNASVSSLVAFSIEQIKWQEIDAMVVEFQLYLRDLKTLSPDEFYLKEVIARMNLRHRKIDDHLREHMRSSGSPNDPHRYELIDISRGGFAVGVVIKTDEGWDSYRSYSADSTHLINQVLMMLNKES